MALNAGDPGDASVDQRGLAVFGSARDQGAYESQGGIALSLAITTDNFDSQTSWEVRRDQDNSVVASGGGYTDIAGANVITSSFCLPADSYRLIVSDAGGNGISGGGYVLTDGSGRRIVDANGMFTSTSSVLLPFSIPLSNMTMQGNSCDRTNVLPNTTLYAKTQPGGQAWQFWFFDPHGSYSRKIIRNVNTVRPNQMVTGPLPLNMDLNVRVRVQVAKVFGTFGAACRLRLPSGGNRASEQDATVITGIYPNPNSGDPLFMNLEDLEVGLETGSVDIYDSFGKRVIAQRIAVPSSSSEEGGRVNSTIRLDGGLAAGLYLVTFTGGTASWVERLIIE